ncbi:MAG: hypothetical protein GY842_08330 [bacterium]|nr:hypothetical protein [bacterium]
MAVQCPQCGSADDHRIVWDLRSILIAVANTLWTITQIIHLSPFHGGWYVRRVCTKCGTRFLGPQREPPNLEECPRCGYNLKGNVSGRCPECGWRLTRYYREYRRQADSRSD